MSSGRMLLRDDGGLAEEGTATAGGTNLCGEEGAISQGVSVPGGQERAGRMPGHCAAARNAEPPHPHLAARKAWPLPAANSS